MTRVAKYRFRIAATALTAAAVTGIYELLKETIAPALTTWRSHGVTVLYVTVVATAAAWVFLRRSSELMTRLQQVEADRERSEEALRESERLLSAREELLRFGFQAARMAIWEWDPVADTLAVSTELSDRFGAGNLPPRRGALADYLGGVHPEDLPAVRASMQNCAAGRTSSHHVKFRAGRKSDGHFDGYEAWGRMFTQADGRQKMVGTLQDISTEMESEARERQAYEFLVASEERFRLLTEQLEKRVAERTLELSSANQELESFCYSVSHDLRAPLRSIDGFSLALLEDYADRLDDEGKRFLQVVRSETQRMGHLIDDLLKLSRVTRGEMTRGPVNLSDLARDCIASQREREPQRQVEVTIAPNLLVTGDVGLLRIVIENLVSNAWKFTRRQPSGRIVVDETTADGNRAFFIRDNGAGFDMQHARKLFEPFQRLHHVVDFEGNGVGLATVTRIVRRHGGKVWAQSKVGEGATFFWTLPDATKAAR